MLVITTRSVCGRCRLSMNIIPCEQFTPTYITSAWNCVSTECTFLLLVVFFWVCFVFFRHLGHCVFGYFAFIPYLVSRLFCCFGYQYQCKWLSEKTRLRYDLGIICWWVCYALLTQSLTVLLYYSEGWFKGGGGAAVVPHWVVPVIQVIPNELCVPAVDDSFVQW